VSKLKPLVLASCVVLAGVLVACVVQSSCLLLLNGGARRAAAKIAGASRVEVFRLDGMSPRTSPPTIGARTIGGFPVTARGADQGGAFADRLAGLLSRPSTYSYAFAGCFWPGVAFRVWKGEECTEVLICFQCDNLYAGPPQDRAMENASFAGSPRRRDLVRLAKEAFPDDPEIQALEEDK
jgi:hypothetical protein